MKKETFAVKIKLGDKGTFDGIAMTVGIPEGKPYFNFTKEAVASQVGTKAKLMLDHSQGSSNAIVGDVKFVRFEGKNLIFEAQLLMEAKDVEDNIYPRVKAGYLDSVSVGVVFEEYEDDPKNKDVLLITKFSIDELSLVPFPAFKKAKIKNAFSAEEKKELKDTVKKMFNEIGIECSDSISFGDIKGLTLPEFEAIMCNVGFSQKLSAKFTSLVKPLLSVNGQSESDDQNIKDEFDIELVGNFLREQINNKK